MSTRPRAGWSVIGMMAALLLSSCATGSNNVDTGVIGAPEVPPTPVLDDRMVTEGGEIYQQYCASCHGADLTGEDEWKTPKADGTYPAPPHDASGHTWHHSDQLLFQIVSEGLDLPNSAMPTYGGQLTDLEILSVIEYLKSNWGAQERAFQWQITWQESQRTD